MRVRRPGVELHARRGYCAIDARDESAPQRVQSLQLAATSPLEATAVGLTLNVETAEQKDSPSAESFYSFRLLFTQDRERYA